MILADAAEEMARLARLLDQGLDALRQYAREFADAEASYRLAKSESWLEAPRELDGTKLTVPERASWVDAETAELRRTRDYAEAMRVAALEAVRSRRAQISAGQSLLAAEREEMAFSRTGVDA